jgi:DNA polymerase-3 subunit alpha
LDYRDGDKVVIGGIVTTYRKKLTKKGDQMAFFRLEDLEGAIEVILVPNVFEKYNRLLAEDLPVLVKGQVTVSEEELPKLRAETMKPLSLPSASEEVLCLIELRAAGLRRQTMTALQQLLPQHQGPCPVMFKYIDSDNSITRIKAGSRFAVSPTEQLKQQVEHLIGENTVFLPSET